MGASLAREVMEGKKNRAIGQSKIYIVLVSWMTVVENDSD